MQTTPWARVAGFALLVPVGLAVTLRWPRNITPRAQKWGLLLLALVARLTLLPHPPDSDVNRYLWEGRLIREGQSPYAHVASASEWEQRRDAYWQGMNQKDLRTIYPPVAEWTFAAIGALRYDATALKLLFIAFDLGVVALLLAMLAARGQPPGLAGLYAFNPVPLIGFAGEAHFDAMLLFFVLLTLWLRERRRPVWSWIAFGLTVQVKLVAILLLPLLLRRGGWRTAWAGGAAVLLPFLPYLADMPAWLAGVRHFGADLAFNGSIHALAWSAFGDRPTAAALCTALLAAWIVGVVLVQGDPWRATFWIFGGLVGLSPTVHYWYLSWALVFLPLFPSLAWLTLSGVMALYFLVLREVQAGRDWGLPSWAQNAIWLAFGAALLREAIIALPALWKKFRRREPAAPVRTFSVVIPTLNEAGNLGGCLRSVARMSPAPAEIIVADAGSVDGTREIAASTGAVIVLAAPGRGHQIATGASVAHGDVVLVLHADAIISPDTGRRILDAFNADPSALGGAVGQRFNADSPGLVVIEMLNDFRALFLGISFGDQGQFFRRAALASVGGFPGLPLMEDVEFSLRARAAGPTLYLGGGLIASDRRWRKERWLKRCLSVIAMTARYRWNRRNAARFTAALYKKYYSTAT
ncbi:MAG: glycosyltransferase family 2 protein [Verrucomicrobia bacterium]|nr:glycosyltransferase family 2 protein [Verrucomicrobiota bacterium]